MTTHAELPDKGTNSHATIDSHIAATAAHGVSSAIVGTTETQTLSNKTLTSPAIALYNNAQHNHADANGGGQINHGVLLGNGLDHHNIYALLAGRPGGQWYFGGNAAADNLYLISTAHSTKGKIYIGDSLIHAFDETNGRLGLGTASPAVRLHINGVAEGMRIQGAGTSGDASLAFVTFYDSNGSTRRGFIGDGSTANDDIYVRADTGALRLGASGADIMHLESGKAGIGTALPATKLHVSASAAVAATLERSDAETDIASLKPTVIVYNPSVANQYNFAQIAFAGKDETDTQRITAAISSQFYRVSATLVGVLSFQVSDGAALNTAAIFDPDGNFNSLRRVRIEASQGNGWTSPGELAIKGHDDTSITLHDDDVNGTLLGSIEYTHANNDFSFYNAASDGSYTFRRSSEVAFRSDEDRNFSVNVHDSYAINGRLHVSNGINQGGLIVKYIGLSDGTAKNILDGDPYSSADDAFMAMVCIRNGITAVSKCELIKVTVGTPYVITFTAGNDVTFALAGGAVTVQRTAGSQIYTMSIIGTWVG